MSFWRKKIEKPFKSYQYSGLDLLLSIVDVVCCDSLSNNHIMVLRNEKKVAEISLGFKRQKEENLKTLSYLLF